MKWYNKDMITMRDDDFPIEIEENFMRERNEILMNQIHACALAEQSMRHSISLLDSRLAALRERLEAAEKVVEEGGTLYLAKTGWFSDREADENARVFYELRAAYRAKWPKEGRENNVCDNS